MEKCSCYISHPRSDKCGYCSGTKERELCLCQGDEDKCDFYPEKRNKKRTTLEMMNLAKVSNKSYQAEDIVYNYKLGFYDKNGNILTGGTFNTLDELFAIDSWQEDDTIYMTKSEAEEKYGIKIVE